METAHQSPNNSGPEQSGQNAAESIDIESFARLFTIPFEPAKALIKSLLDTFFHIEVNGTENIPLEGGGLIICNHTDIMDVPVQGTYSPRKLLYLGKVELFEPDEQIKRFLYQKNSPFNNPFFAPVRPFLETALKAYGYAQRIQLYEWGGHPIKRNYKGEGARAAVEYYQELEEYIVGLLKDGKFISIFPEGTRTETGVMQPFKALAAKLAIRAGVPIVPSGISGAYRFSSMESLFSGQIFRTRIQYNIGKPITPAEFPAGDEKRSAKELTALVEKQVYALTLHPERRDQGRGKARVL